MSTSVTTRPTGKRYLGNRNPASMEVHDLTNEKAQCQVPVIIRNGHGVVFSPDILPQAHSEGFDNCRWCIGDSRR
ncbi:MAG TPA: hypothetical protein DGT21_07560 [Armatimonadetes bacterium]|jgi:hypothetical protein|nr:hypothetical protein [Armatimonadota bacterium]